MILRKEDKTMNYAKPEIAVLGTAVRVIEQIGPTSKPDSQSDGGGELVNPAYDLDE